jgi:hypothetical protein
MTYNTLKGCILIHNERVLKSNARQNCLPKTGRGQAPFSGVWNCEIAMLFNTIWRV